MILFFTLLVIVLAHFIRGQDKEVKICTPIVTLNLIAVVAEQRISPKFLQLYLLAC